MRNSVRFAAAGAALAVSLGFASAALAATDVTADARAEVLSTLTVVQTQTLDFAQIAVNGDGDIVIGADGTTPACPATLVCAGTRTRAEFDVAGTADVNIAAQVTDTSVDLVHATDNTKNFALDNFTVSYPGGTLLAGGATTVAVGGTLHVLSAEALAGVYNGTFNLSVEYQ